VGAPSHSSYRGEGGFIGDPETQVYGWVCTHLIEEGFNEEGRWVELRSRVEECEINHLFYAYLGKPTPQPHLSEEAQEIDYSPEDRGWSHIPAGYLTNDAYWADHEHLRQLALDSDW
jgi:hypothetical protein